IGATTSQTYLSDLMFPTARQTGLSRSLLSPKPPAHQMNPILTCEPFSESVFRMRKTKNPHLNPLPRCEAEAAKEWSAMRFLGSARVPRAGDGALAIANFSPSANYAGLQSRTDCGEAPQSARDARALPGIYRRIVGPLAILLAVLVL